jgi:hypothetical protein
MHSLAPLSIVHVRLPRCTAVPRHQSFEHFGPPNKRAAFLAGVGDVFMDWGVEVFRMLGFSAERLACFRCLCFKVSFRGSGCGISSAGGRARVCPPAAVDSCNARWATSAPALDCPLEDIRSGNVEARVIQGDCLIMSMGEIPQNP